MAHVGEMPFNNFSTVFISTYEFDLFIPSIRELRCNETLYNENPGITNDILQPSKSKMYGK